MKNYDFEKINAYLDNELSREEKADFEAQLLEDINLQQEVRRLQDFLVDLKELPKIKTDRNFMISLNEKIDQYELSKNKKWYSNLLNFLPDYSPAQLGLASLSLVVVFTLTFFITQNTSEGNHSLNANKTIDENPSPLVDGGENPDPDKEEYKPSSDAESQDPIANGVNNFNN